MSARIISLLKSWAQKLCNFESYRLDSKLESKIFQLNSHWYKSHRLKSTHSRQFNKHRINHDSENIHAIDNILTSLVHSTVHASRIFNYGSASDPPSPPHDPPVAAALEEADVYLIHEYIWRRQASITAHVACFPIYKLFTDMERRLGTSRIMRWWDQDIVQ